MKDGNSKKTGFSGSIGTISSKLTIEGPVIKDRTTFSDCRKKDICRPVSSFCEG